MSADYFSDDWISNRIAPEPNTGCWLWTMQLNHDGYGLVRLGTAKKRLAHREFYRHFVGPIPDGHIVMHRCDVPPCCNPAHLRAGTQQENIHDRQVKGRQGRGEAMARSKRGEGNPQAKLTPADVRAMRADAAKGIRPVELGKKYAVSHSQVSRILSGTKWSHTIAEKP